mgnify:CR=1 FL=1
MTETSPPAPGPALLRAPLHPAIDEAMIRALVTRFYGRVREDGDLGPIFAAAVDDWDAHIDTLCDFWSSIMLKSGRYHGRPMPVHARLSGVRPDHFDTWLGLFRETARETCGEAVAPIFIERAERIAESFRLGMFYRPDRPWPG